MKTLIFSVAALILTGTLFIGLQNAWSDDDDRYEESGRWERMKMRSTGVAPISNPIYQEECGACHMAYPPGLLPSASWRRIMNELEDHFGESAELDEQTTQILTGFLDENAADRSNYRRSRAMMNKIQSPDGLAPLRITDLPYFRHEHDEIPQRIIKLPEVGSLSQCNACHLNAERGSFNEHEISIKGVGRRDD